MRVGSSERDGGEAAASQEGDASDNVTDRDSLSFISGNPFVETTRGILHLYKEKYVLLASQSYKFGL